MTRHLTQDEIDRYVSRTAPVDEILAAAEHLDGCFDCRDRAAALVDDGTGDRPHGRRPELASPAPRTHRVLFWTVMAIVVVAVAVILILYRP